MGLLILKKIHLLDPPGVGARDLKECLVIQLKRKNNSKSVESAINILEKLCLHPKIRDLYSFL